MMVVSPAAFVAVFMIPEDCSATTSEAGTMRLPHFGGREHERP